MTNKEKAIEIRDKLGIYADAYYGALEMAEWKDEQPIVEQCGWHTENPTEDCFVLLETNEFPKNCRYIVAEWDNDAKCFYSESSDFPVYDWDRWKFINVNNFIL